MLASTVLMTGCLTLSVYPLYTAKDLVTDIPLEGKWTDPTAKEIWEFSKGGDTYVATSPTDSHPEPVTLHVVRLGDQRFLDLTANETPSLAVEGHLFGKVWVKGDELRIQLMSSTWLEKKAREAGLAFLELPNKDLLLTAPTADLQKLVLRYADDPAAYDEPTVLKRMR